jgi:F-type H+-transporting ATPase subunit c
MKKIVKISTCAAILVLASATAALAQQPAGMPTGGAFLFTGAGFGGALGMAITIVGAGFGMGKIGAAALESMARQPEVAGNIQTAMIIIAAMLEGATLASVILCFLVGNKSVGL